MPKGVYRHRSGFKQSKEHIEKRIEARMAYGYFKDPQKFSETIRRVTTGKKQTKEHILKRIETTRRLGKFNFTKEHREKLSINATKRLSKIGYKWKGLFWSVKNNKNIPYRSNYELLAFTFLERFSDVVSYIYEPFHIAYQDKEGIRRRTVPDLLVFYSDGSKKLIEIKPQFKINGNIDGTLEKLRLYKEYAENNDMRFEVWTEKELNLRGALFELFDKHYRPNLEPVPF
jgi:hypothetical protein